MRSWDGKAIRGYPHGSMALSSSLSSLNRNRERQQTSLPRKKDFSVADIDDDSDAQKVGCITMEILKYWSTALARKTDEHKGGCRNVLEQRNQRMLTFWDWKGGSA